MTPVDRIKVFVCYEHPVIQAGLMALLTPYSDLDCCTGDGAAPNDVRSAPPDVIVTDHNSGMILANAMDRTAILSGRPRILVLTHLDRECDISAALSSGAKGYLLIDDAPEYLAAAIRDIRSGCRFLSPRIASRLAEHVALEALTQREEAVLGLVVEGLCNKSVGNRLGITAGTVKSHLRSVFGKLGAASRTEAVAIVQRRGLLQRGTASHFAGHRQASRAGAL